MKSDGGASKLFNEEWKPLPQLVGVFVWITIRRINTSTTNLGEAERAPWLDRWKVQLFNLRSCMIWHSSTHSHVTAAVGVRAEDNTLPAATYHTTVSESDFAVFSRLSDSWFTSQCFIALGWIVQQEPHKLLLAQYIMIFKHHVLIIMLCILSNEQLYDGSILFPMCTCVLPIHENDQLSRVPEVCYVACRSSSSTCSLYGISQQVRPQQETPMSLEERPRGNPRGNRMRRRLHNRTQHTLLSWSFHVYKYTSTHNGFIKLFIWKS